MSDASLDTVQDVIDALGGPTKASRIVGCSPQSIVNSRNQGYFPPSYYRAMTEALETLSLKADPQLWRQREPLRCG
jgi:hypothetical protein